MAESGQVQTIIQNAKDAMHNAFKTVEIEHSEIHQGNFYSYVASTSVLGASSWIYFQINTPASSVAEVHMVANYNNSGGLIEKAKFEIPSTNYIPSLTSVIPFNHNRNSTKTSAVVLFLGTTGTILTSTATSTQVGYLSYEYDGSTGTNQARGSAVSRNTNEWVLKANSTYIYKMTNLGSAGYSSLRLDWYE